MKLTYKSIGNGKLLVELGVKPDGAQEATNLYPADSQFRKEIPAKMELTFEGLTEEVLQMIPKTVLACAVSHAKVGMQASIRALGGEADYETRYAKLQDECSQIMQYVVTEEQAEKAASKKLEPLADTLNRLIKVYGATEAVKHLGEAQKMLEDGKDPKAVLIAIASKIEKKNQK